MKEDKTRVPPNIAFCGHVHEEANNGYICRYINIKQSNRITVFAISNAPGVAVTRVGKESHGGKNASVGLRLLLPLT